MKQSMRSKRIMLLLIAVVLDGDGEYRKAWRLIAVDVDFKHLILIWFNAYFFNLPFGDLFHRTKSKGSCYEIFTIICNRINLFINHHVALGLLKLEQRASNGEESSLCTPDATRWNSVCDAAKCFQESYKPIRSLILTKEIYWNQSLKQSGTRKK